MNTFEFARSFALFGALSLGVTVGCGSKGTTGGGSDSGGVGADSGSGGSGGGSATGGDDGGTDSGGSSNPDAPEVTSADAWCYLHSTGEKAYFWSVVVQADDPQGSDTLESMIDDAVTISTNGVEVTTETLVCLTGECFTTFTESDDGISCTNATGYEFAIKVMDIDENWSEVYTVTGRQGTDTEG